LRKQKTVKSFFTNSPAEPSKKKKSQASDEGSTKKLTPKSPLPTLPTDIMEVKSPIPMDTQTGLRSQKRDATPQSLKKGVSVSKKVKVASPNRSIDSFFAVKPKRNS
jgi:hypothetical protein